MENGGKEKKGVNREEVVSDEGGLRKKSRSWTVSTEKQNEI